MARILPLMLRDRFGGSFRSRWDYDRFTGVTHLDLRGASTNNPANVVNTIRTFYEKEFRSTFPLVDTDNSGATVLKGMVAGSEIEVKIKYDPSQMSLQVDTEFHKGIGFERRY